MIYAYLIGRLGNNLFQIAAAASLAKKMGVPCQSLIDRNYLLPVDESGTFSDYVESFKTTIFRKIVIQEDYPEEAIEYLEPAHYHSLPEQDDLILKGYFQSEKYFDKELVRHLFEIDEETKQYILKKYGSVLNAKNTVSVTVRRGDYVFLTAHYILCQQYYYQRAMAYMGKDKTFVIISDDIDWCRKNLKGKNLFFIEDEPPLIDLYLASMCQHNIISNSSFAWWGAWLNPNPDKIVIYPSMWFGPLSRGGRPDLCPATWTPIAVQNKIVDCWKKSRLAFYYYKNIYQKKRSWVKGILPAFLVKWIRKFVE